MADAVDYALDIREGRLTLEKAPKKLHPLIRVALANENLLITRAKDRAAARQVPASTRMIPVRSRM